MQRDTTRRAITYLVFTEAKYDHWIWRFVDKKLGHVYIIKEYDNQWAVIQPRVSITTCDILMKCNYPVIRAITGKDDKIVRVETLVTLEPRGGLNWFTCVEQAKAFVGISSLLTFTPKQLYNGLIEGRYGNRC